VVLQKEITNNKKKIGEIKFCGHKAKGREELFVQKEELSHQRKTRIKSGRFLLTCSHTASKRPGEF